MENFENNARRVRQKNFYLLHLDAPRIIIIMTVIIGIIAGAFLLGMNLELNDDRSNLAMKKNNLIIDEHKELGMLNNLPDLGDDEISTKNMPEEENLTLESVTRKETPKIVKREMEPPSDISIGKNVQVVSTKTIPRKSKPEKIVKKKAQKKEIAKRTKRYKSNKKKKKARKSVEKRSSDVVEVSYSDRNFRPRNNKSPHFSIQIASYDKKTKAISEMRSLKNKHFDAYINKSKVKGKNYYRVRVGPFKSKSGALNLLNEIQNFDRYEDSYMVKE